MRLPLFFLRSAILAIMLTLSLTSTAAGLTHTDNGKCYDQLEATHNDTPSWEELGLEDLLIAPIQTSWSAPQNASTHFGSAYQRMLLAATSAFPSPVGRKLHSHPLHTHQSNDYYLFFLYRLRL